MGHILYLITALLNYYDGISFCLSKCETSQVNIGADFLILLPSRKFDIPMDLFATQAQTTYWDVGPLQHTATHNAGFTQPAEAPQSTDSFLSVPMLTD